MLEREEPRIRSEYVYRRPLAGRELLPALGIGVGVGAVAFYLAYVVLQRTPLDPGRTVARTPSSPRRGRADD